MDDIMVTIFTPTYNRKECLIKLGESLLGQTNKTFEWIVVDDGSTDGTEDVIKKFEGKINLRYVYQKNSGKHVAFNKGIEMAEGDLFVCVDSDDILRRNAVEVYLSEYDNCDKYIGYVFPQCLSGENDIKKWEKIDGRAVDITDLKFLYGIKESNVTIKVKSLKRYWFPIFYKDENSIEKFCPEEYLYNALSKVGKFKVTNKNVYISEYRVDGLTNKIFSLWIENSEGVLRTLGSRYVVVSKYGFFMRIVNQVKCILNINALCMKTKKDIFQYSPNKLWSIVLFIPSIAFKIKRFGKIEKRGIV